MRFSQLVQFSRNNDRWVQIGLWSRNGNGNQDAFCPWKSSETKSHRNLLNFPWSPFRAKVSFKHSYRRFITRYSRGGVKPKIGLWGRGEKSFEKWNHITDHFTMWHSGGGDGWIFFWSMVFQKNLVRFFLRNGPILCFPRTFENLIVLFSLASFL